MTRWLPHAGSGARNFQQGKKSATAFSIAKFFPGAGAENVNDRL